LDKEKRLAPHESFDLHELLTFKNICATKSGTMVKLVTDDELKSILDQDFSNTQEHIKELKGLLQYADFATME